MQVQGDLYGSFHFYNYHFKKVSKFISSNLTNMTGFMAHVK